MKIGFYIHHTSLKAGGLFPHSIGILKLLVKLNEIEKIHLIISSDQKKNFQSIIDNPKVQLRLINRKNLFTNIRFAISYLLSNAIALHRNKFQKPNHLKFLSTISNCFNPYKKHINSKQFDLLHVPFQYSPIYNVDVPVIITMHDIQEYHYPENFTSSQKLHRKINNIRAMYESDHIIVSYEHIKKDILKYFKVKESKVTVCLPSFAGEWFLSNKITAKSILKEKYELNNQFLLYPAATWKHKNHVNLVKAIAMLSEDNWDLQLICTGNKTKHYQSIKEKIDSLKIVGKVNFLGIVEEEDLIGLYKTTALVVIPTLYEAGSGPLYEAMRYSAPVICSNVTSLPETMGNDNYLFNPNSVEEITYLIKRMLTDDIFRKENLKNSKRRMEELKSMDYAKKIIDVYKKVMDA
ncbi:MAG: glycosyltransferase family 4 protein [Ignavibacteria bacterium]|nr:glycosyltransferase family 4 protein [Ignavibacteria bacterium]MBT8390584.1 glycosyltransferase family 4 protein [Ignavibacteria bacterium]